MSFCVLCGASAVKLSLNLGRQALSNRFLSDPRAEEAHFEFVLGQCGSCGMVQLLNPVPALELKPRVEWISYRESEGHLDKLAERLVALPGISKSSQIGAISAKDDSILARLRDRGLSGWRLDIQEDLGAEDNGAGPETIQFHLCETAASIVERRGMVDILVARHIVEHAQDPRSFVRALLRLIKPGGYLLIEVPDCEPALRRMDYTMPWEEHVLYFTPELLKHAAQIWGVMSVDFNIYPYQHENSLVLIACAQEIADTQAREYETEKVIALGDCYARSFSGYRQRVRNALSSYRANRGSIAMFGAGHLSAAWINFLDVGDCIEFVVDDDPHKRNLYMPGSRLPIVPSEKLTNSSIVLCLTSLNQESEAKVVARNGDFVERGGCFASIFPERSNSFPAPEWVAAHS